MQNDNYQELGDLLGLDLRHAALAQSEFFEMNVGHQMVALETLARLRCETYEALYSEIAPNFSAEEFRRYCKTLHAFKLHHLLIDFTDMLQMFNDNGECPKLKLLLVDEAQDLCQLQWRIVERLSENSDRTVIAGDDDQAIFKWSGADVEKFIAISKETKTTVLDQSYRLPEKVFSFAKELSSRIGQRVDKKFSPVKKQGNLFYVNDLSDIDMDKGQWLILVRSNYMQKDIVEHIRSMGYPYEGRFDDHRRTRAYEAALNWEAMKKRGSAFVKEVKEILSFTKKGSSCLKGKNDDDTVTIKEFEVIFGASVSELLWYEVLTKISYEDRIYFQAARRRGESLIGKPRIKISTIHGAKGGESENVVVMTDVARRTFLAMERDPDDEIRVFYVAATRAKENLFIVMPRTKNFFQV
jgi:superfamily I DNA/RNA helicase